MGRRGRRGREGARRGEEWWGRGGRSLAGLSDCAEISQGGDSLSGESRESHTVIVNIPDTSLLNDVDSTKSTKPKLGPNTP